MVEHCHHDIEDQDEDDDEGVSKAKKQTLNKKAQRCGGPDEIPGHGSGPRVVICVCLPLNGRWTGKVNKITNLL